MLDLLLNGRGLVTTRNLVQAFKQVGRKLVADPLQRAKTADHEMARAEQLGLI